MKNKSKNIIGNKNKIRPYFKEKNIFSLFNNVVFGNIFL